jgi:hypothetical protein
MVAALALTLLFAQNLGTPLDRGFAHNDYAHPRPLWDALANGFTFVEADVFLVDGKLLVAHDLKDVKPERSLEELYLKPLLMLSKAKKDPIYSGYKKPFWLMIDIKADGVKVYAELEKLLVGYRPMLSKWTDAGKGPGSVAIVLSGDRPVTEVAKQKERWVAIDGRPDDLAKNPPIGLTPWISTAYSDFKWTFPELTAEQRTTLKSYIDKAHEQKRLVRFWGTPDTPAFWRMQGELGVDLLNTDKLVAFREWAAGRRG